MSNRPNKTAKQPPVPQSKLLLHLKLKGKGYRTLGEGTRDAMKERDTY